jgi:hypothetical protein
MFLSFQAVLNGHKLTIIPYSFLFESFYYLLVGLLNRLGFVVFYHDFIESIFKNPYGSHHGIFLNIAEFVVLNFFEFVLQCEKEILLNFGLMFLFVKQNPEVVFISRSYRQFIASGVVGCVREDKTIFLVCYELISYAF